MSLVSFFNVATRKIKIADVSHYIYTEQHKYKQCFLVIYYKGKQINGVLVGSEVVLRRIHTMGVWIIHAVQKAGSKVWKQGGGYSWKFLLYILSDMKAIFKLRKSMGEDVLFRYTLTTEFDKKCLTVGCLEEKKGTLLGNFLCSLVVHNQRHTFLYLFFASRKEARGQPCLTLLLLQEAELAGRQLSP